VSDPVWKPLLCSVAKLCNGDYDRPIFIECFDWDKDGQDFIGSCQTTLKHLVDNKSGEFPLINPKNQSKKHYTNSGTLHFNNTQLVRSYTFLDYLVGGCEISLIVAIDFTGSNGDPKSAHSLHNINPHTPNEYVQAICSVGSILSVYDYDRKFPVYGFGGHLPTGTSHCFPLNANISNPEVFDIGGILQVYQQAIYAIPLSGPTYFQQILHQAVQIASTAETQENQKYYILLILTDGVIMDMENTVAEIVNNTDKPLSILIVGVGNENFSQMRTLDGDDQALSSKGKVAARDIVQFVPMKDFKNQPPYELTKAVLAEIPNQLLAYMKMRGFVPNPPNSRQAKPVYETAPIPQGMAIPPGTLNL